MRRLRPHRRGHSARVEANTGLVLDRVALDWEQVERYDLPPAIGKATERVRRMNGVWLGQHARNDRSANADVDAAPLPLAAPLRADAVAAKSRGPGAPSTRPRADPRAPPSAAVGPCIPRAPVGG